MVTTENKSVAELGVKVRPVKTERDNLTPRTIAFIFALLIAAAIVATGIGIPKGNASSISKADKRTATESESPISREESSTTRAETEIEDADNSPSEVTTTTIPSTNFEEPVTLGIDSVEVEIA